MAVYKIYPEKDSTLYSLFPQMNTGIDEIVETTTTTFGEDVFPQVSRTLIKFSNNDINNVIDNIIGGVQFLSESRLRLYLATAEGLNENTTIETYPISGSWNMGTGKYLDNPITTNGCSWQWQDFSGSKLWKIHSFEPIGYVTASMDPLGIGGGGTWYTKNPQNNEVLDITQSFSYHGSKDINFNVTDITKIWYSSSKGLTNGNPQIQNEGFIIKQTDENEFVYVEDKATELKYFSIDTNTIYPPQLEFKWVDYSFDTGSSTKTILTDRNLVATLRDNPGTFRSGSVYNFRIDCRSKFPAKSFATSSIYTLSHFLPTSSFYAIKDLDTNEFVINFDDNYTQISADSESSYFKIYMNGLEPQRYYQILIKTTIGDDTLILDDNYYFKIVNG